MNDDALHDNTKRDRHDGGHTRTERDPVEMGLLAIGVLVLVGALVARGIMLGETLSDSSSRTTAVDQVEPHDASALVASDSPDVVAALTNQPDLCTLMTGQDDDASHAHRSMIVPIVEPLWGLSSGDAVFPVAFRPWPWLECLGRWMSFA